MRSAERQFGPVQCSRNGVCGKGRQYTCTVCLCRRLLKIEPFQQYDKIMMYSRHQPPPQEQMNNTPYSRKIWRGIKFGGLAVYITTAKLKPAKISYSHIYVWQSRTEPPNLNQPIYSSNSDLGLNRQI